MDLTPRRLVLLFALDVAAIGALVLGQVDLRMHRRDPVYGVNQWGYRGEARGHKGPGPELRIAIVGGSAAFEAGTANPDTFASSLFFELQTAASGTDQGYSVVNLAAPRVGADTYPGTLRRYRFLDPDILVIFDGYDVLTGLPPHAREQSAMFSLTGYLPLLPAQLLGRPAWLSDADGGIAAELRDDIGPEDVSCAGASRSYCAAMVDTVRTALDDLQRPVVVATPPAVSQRHRRQQQSLAEMLRGTFERDARFRYLDVTTEVSLERRINSPDGVRRTPVGNHEVAVRVGKAIAGWLAAGWAGGIHRPK